MLADFTNLGRNVLQAGHQAIASNINTLVSDRQAERVAKAASKALAATKTPTDLLGAAGTSILLRISQVGADPELTGFWHQSA